MTWKWSLPDRVNQYLRENQPFDHLGLLLDKFTPYAEYEYQEKERGRWINKTGYRLGRDDRKRDWLDKALGYMQGKAKSNPALTSAMVANRDRWLNVIETSRGGYELFRTISPLIVGLGAGHVLETSITLDLNTGAPIIPGSALKGLARSVGLSVVAQELITEGYFSSDVNPVEKLNALDHWLGENDTLDTPEGLQSLAEVVLNKEITSLPRSVISTMTDFQNTFGTPIQAGQVVFMDGIYIGDKLPAYHIDIMTVHYPKYYTGSAAPSDDQSPVPVPYLTVDVGIPFGVGILPRTAAVSTQLLRRAMEWIERGLTEFGVGAKTAQGYGLFTKM